MTYMGNLNEDLENLYDMNDIEEEEIKVTNGPFYGRIVESSLSKVYQHNMDENCVVLSACKYYCTEQENKQRTKELMSCMKQNKWGYIPLAGGYRETVKDNNGNIKYNAMGEEEKETVTEHSFMIPFPNQRENISDLTDEDKGRTFEDLKKFGLAMAKKFDQDSIMVVEEGKAKFITPTGDEDVAGDFKIAPYGSKNTYFSALAKKNDNNREWIFEGVVARSQTYLGRWNQYLRGEAGNFVK